MKINGTATNLFNGSQGVSKFTFGTQSETLLDKATKSVKVTISEKGQEYYRKKLKELSGDNMSYDSVEENKNKLLEANLTASDVEYDFVFGEELGKNKKDGTYLSSEEKASNLLKTYATLYDEIVQGYVNGTREIHVEDINSEKGYRILTKEEELTALNESYKKYTDDLEAQIKQAPEFHKAFEKYMKTLERIGAKKPSLAQDYYEKEYIKQKEEAVPDKVSERLAGAASIFREQYELDYNKINITELLSKIKIF